MHPLLYETFAVRLTSWAPHGRSFTAVKHAELDSTTVCDNTHLSSEGIYLANYLSFGYTTDGRVTTHLPDGIHVHRDEKSATTEVCRSGSSLVSGVACAHNYYIVCLRHFFRFHRLFDHLFSGL